MYVEFEERIMLIINELELQKRIENFDSAKYLSHTDSIYQIKEFVLVGEYGVAYMSLVIYLESYSFKISSYAAVKLLELGLLMGFKTDREEDKVYNINSI